jgi:hypothetical protein
VPSEVKNGFFPVQEIHAARKDKNTDLRTQGNVRDSTEIAE